MHWLRPIVCATALSTSLSVTDATGETRVAYAEGFSPVVTAPVGAQKSTQVQRVRVRAFGQELPLRLEDNSRLSAYVPATVRNRGAFKLLRGSVEGRESSWVRLTLRNGRYEGAIWDGSELYAVEPRDALPPDQYLGGDATTVASVIYRASDIINDGDAMTCGIGNEPITGNALQQYKSFVRELQGAAPLASRDIEVAMVADYEYHARFGPTSLETMISRMNMVDGIFATQLNVNIIPTDFTVFASPDDPFESAEPSTLLYQFGTYRNSTPAIRARGLAHLFTGRDLNGTIVGVAYRGVLCEPEAGVSLSEAGYSPVLAMLIIAHEIGHNFGAEHDGVPGSACSTTPQTFLMSPVINSSSTFSSCSIQTMETFATSAACVTPARTRDVAVTVPASPVVAVVNQAFDYVVDVASIGQGTAYNIIATASFHSSFRLLSASMPEASCTISGNTVNCPLVSLEAGETRRLTVNVNPTNDGTFNTRAEALASNDLNPDNNRLDVPVQVNVLHAASIVFTPATPSVVIRSPFEIAADITATGTESLTDAVARVRAPSLQVASVSVEGVACVQDQSGWTCALQSLAPQQVRTITIQASAMWVGQAGAVIEVSAGTDPQRVISTRGSTIIVTPEYDIAITPQGGSGIVAIGDIAEFPITIASLGSQPVPGARMRIRGSTGVTLEFVAPGVTCTLTGPAPDWAGPALECDLTSILPGVTVAGVLLASADAAIRTYIDFDVPQSVPDDYRINNHFLRTLDVRPGSDVGVSPYSAPFTQRDGVRVDRRFVISSFGATPPSDVRATITLPTSFTIHSASIAGGTCIVTGSTTACQLASMTTSSSGVDLSYTAAEPGNYVGSIEVTAASDAVPTNNSAQLEFTVLPNVDARLVIPTGLYTLVNEPIDVQLDVVNDRYVMAGARLDIDVNPSMVEAIRTSAAVCSPSGTGFTCPLGTLAASTTTTVTLRIRPTSEIGAFLYARFSAPDDVNSINNQAQVVIVVDPRGDAVLTVPNTTGTAIVNQRHTVSDIRVRALTPVRDVFIEFFFDGTRISQPEVPYNVSSCNWTESSVRCPLNGVLSVGSSLPFEFSFTPTTVGPLSIRIRAGARNETNPVDNEQTISLDVQAPPLPSGGSTSTSKSGGGGGSMPLSLLSALLGIWLMRGARFMQGCKLVK